MFLQWLYRWTAFSFFVCAAFAWTPPFLDRAGLAAFGFGFLALSLGRAWGVARAGASPFLDPRALFPQAADSPGGLSLAERVSAYADEGSA